MADYSKELTQLQEFVDFYEGYWNVLRDPFEYYGDPDEVREGIEAAKRSINERLPLIERLVVAADESAASLPSALQKDHQGTVLTVLQRTIGAYKAGLPWKESPSPVVESAGDAPQATPPERPSVPFSAVRENFKNHPVVWVTGIVIPFAMGAFFAGRSYQSDLDAVRAQVAGVQSGTGTPPAAAARLAKVDVLLNKVKLGGKEKVPASRHLAFLIQNATDLKIPGLKLEISVTDARTGTPLQTLGVTDDLLPSAIGVPLEHELDLPADPIDVLIVVEGYGENVPKFRYEVPMTFPRTK